MVRQTHGSVKQLAAARIIIIQNNEHFLDHDKNLEKSADDTQFIRLLYDTGNDISYPNGSLPYPVI